MNDIPAATAALTEMNSLNGLALSGLLSRGNMRTCLAGTYWRNRACKLGMHIAESAECSFVVQKNSEHPRSSTE